jgi:hypothetical protein
MSTAGQLSARSSDSVQQAQEYIYKLLKEQEGDAVQVPRKYHHAITEDGRRLRDEHRASADHGGAELPRHPTSARGGAKRQRVNGTSSIPLITDDPSVARDTHSWELLDSANADVLDDGSAIPWTLRGPPAANIAKARAQVEAALAKVGTPAVTGYLILPDLKVY